MRGPLRRIGGDTRGAAAVLVAVCLMALVGVAGFAIDLGHVFTCSRQLQGSADLAAMAAVQAMADAGGSASDAAQASAQTTAGLNLWPGAATTAVTTVGAYDPDPAMATSARFVSGQGSGTVPPNAVKVTLNAQVPLYFASLLTGGAAVGVSRSATAAQTRLAAFSIGSALAAMNGGVANSVLSALTGSQVALSVLDYQALANAQVSLFDYVPALRTRAGVQAVSFDQILSARTRPSDQLAALSDALSQEGQTAAAAAAHALSVAAGPLAADTLSSLIDMGPYGGQDHAQGGHGAMVSVSALAMSDALIGAANGSRQLALSLDGVAPGLAGLKAWLAIGQRPSGSAWLAIGSTGSVTVATAQMRLYLQAGVGPGPAGGLTGGALLNMPVYVQGASGVASLKALQCTGAPSAQGFDLNVTPSLGTLAIANIDPSTLSDFTQTVALTPATLFNAPMLKATAFGQLTLGGGASGSQGVHFTAADIAAVSAKTVSTSNLASATVASLLGSTTLQVQAANMGLGIGNGGTSALLASALAPAAVALDGVIGQLEAVTGVSLGAVTVWPNGLRCNGAALVG